MAERDADIAARERVDIEVSWSELGLLAWLRGENGVMSDETIDEIVRAALRSDSPASRYAKEHNKKVEQERRRGMEAEYEERFDRPASTGGERTIELHENRVVTIIRCDPPLRYFPRVVELDGQQYVPRNRDGDADE